MAVVSVLVPLADSGSALPGLLRSLDEQTLPAADFEVVAVDASGGDGSERLRRAAARRANVVVVDVDPAADEAARLGAALERASGEHLLVLSQRRRLAPRALQVLLDRARTGETDLVLGRVASRASSGSRTLPEDSDGVDTAALDPAGCLALVRRSALDAQADPGAALLAPAALPGGAIAVAGYACAVEEAPPAPEQIEGAVDAPAYRWADGALRLEVGVRLPGLTRAWLVLTDGTADVALPADLHAEADRTVVSGSVDPRTALGGAPLTDGPWDLRLRVARHGGETTLALRPGRRWAAVVDGRPHVVRGIDGVLRLDAGARRSSALARTPRSLARVDESVDGTLLTLRYPDVHVHGDAVLPARLLLDRFGLPARVVCDEGGARLEAWVSGLAGTSTLSVLLGRGSPQRTGLRLHIDGVGVMSLRDQPPPAPQDGRPTPPLVQRLRHGLPSTLEPAARRLARVPALRTAYRRLLSR